MEHTCDTCATDWSHGKWHIDVWTGNSTVNGGQAQLDCENALTPSSGHNVIRNGNTGHAPNSELLCSHDPLTSVNAPQLGRCSPTESAIRTMSIRTAIEVQGVCGIIVNEGTRRMKRLVDFA